MSFSSSTRRMVCCAMVFPFSGGLRVACAFPAEVHFTLFACEKGTPPSAFRRQSMPPAPSRQGRVPRRGSARESSRGVSCLQCSRKMLSPSRRCCQYPERTVLLREILAVFRVGSEEERRRFGDKSVMGNPPACHGPVTPAGESMSNPRETRWGARGPRNSEEPLRKQANILPRSFP